MYLVASSNPFHSFDVSFKFRSIGVEIRLLSTMLNMFNNSPMYFFWEMNMYFRS